MKADALNARNLFDGNVHYEIPVFQRPYVWDEESQWAPLWTDIIRVAERVVPPKMRRRVPPVWRSRIMRAANRAARLVGR